MLLRPLNSICIIIRIIISYQTILTSSHKPMLFIHLNANHFCISYILVFSDVCSMWVYLCSVHNALYRFSFLYIWTIHIHILIFIFLSHSFKLTISLYFFIFSILFFFWYFSNGPFSFSPQPIEQVNLFTHELIK